MTEELHAAVQRGDREHLDAMVSPRMIWVMPLKDNERGKEEWIAASCRASWHWFRVSVRRELVLGTVHVVESLVEQSRDPVQGEDGSRPVITEGLVVDVWAVEDATWRLVARHPGRIT